VSSSRPPLPPFTAETAARKARVAEDAWNTRDPERVAAAYTPDSRWRNRAEFFSGREAIVAFLHRKWARELDHRLVKEVWAHAGECVAVRFAYEWRDDSGHWFRSHGDEQRGSTRPASCAGGRRASTTCPSPRRTGCSAGRPAPGPTTTRA